MLNCWLIKSEPSDYSIDDLERDGRSPWTGVRNYQARNTMRDLMKEGDPVLFYHSSIADPAIVGLGKVSSKPYPDPTALDKASPYYDPKVTPTHPIWFLVDIAFVEKFPNPLSLRTIRTIPELQNMRLVQKGSRLSVQPVSETEFRYIMRSVQN